MACRKIVTNRQRAAVALMLDGMSQRRALLQVGYSRSSARCPRLLFKHSWGLRAALMEAQERSGHYLRPNPVRKKRYDRRSLAITAQTYCQPDFQAASTNAGIRHFDKMASEAKRIAAGLPPKVDEPKRLTRCPSCGAMVDERNMFLNFSQTMSVCPRCAGVS
jgi:hypothetical protein